MGKWHEVVSMMTTWSKKKTITATHNTPVILDTLLKCLIDEREAGNTHVHISTDVYNTAISAWDDRAHTVVSKDDTF